MKLKNYKISIALLLLFFPVIALAEPVVGQAGLDIAAGQAGFPTGQQADVYVVVTRWINGFLSIFMMVFTYFIISAGFAWMTSGGNAEKVLAAKTTIKNALMGIMIAFISYSLARYLLLALGKTTGIVQ